MDHYKLRKAQGNAEDELLQAGIEYNFDLMEYVDPEGNVIPGEKIAAQKREIISREMAKPDRWTWDWATTDGNSATDMR